MTVPRNMMTKAIGTFCVYQPLPLFAKKAMKVKKSGRIPRKGSRIQSISGLKASHTNPTPQTGPKSAARGMLFRRKLPKTIPATSNKPPTKLALHPPQNARLAKSSGEISMFAGLLSKRIGNITMKTVRKPAGVLMPYGKAVTSRRFSFFASLHAIQAYHTLPKRRATPMPGHICLQTIFSYADWYSPTVRPTLTFPEPSIGASGGANPNTIFGMNTASPRIAMSEDKLSAKRNMKALMSPTVILR
mmetsp:Transcript_31997/g.56581  ORF Transcript_31997/g.56581 Transcript_31997/m.56581 type:complete len:246 (-) Transcript_31997:105-842(-)